MTTYDEVFTRVLSGDLDTIIQNRQGEWDREEIFGKKDEAGRNVLAAASLLGRSAIVRELVSHGARVNEQTVRGYSSLHLAACWGHVDTVRSLLELGANIQATTFRGERPVDLARKYSKTGCVDCLTLAEAKQDLMSYIVFIKDMVSHSERNLTNEEKNFCLRVCSTKSDWIQSFKNPTLWDFTAQRKDIEDSLQYILTKLSAQPADMPAKGENV
ncbi:ankyrin repeat domain-containing protein 45 isoform X2 [Anabas testudineus]|uniref:Ankyrin repeat domain 45 n=1 Tax=Anabas testudineus TaxID=64144 RepID=A0A3Q1H732_ANATE|nr:ankyrin repeat domain-containing protein 45 isoform X2 [Anabas testudineus]